MLLTPRLQAVADLVSGKIVADIGTDHGKIPIYLAKNDIAEKVIASDINKGPIDACKKNVSLHDVCEKIECRMGAGLSVLNPFEAESVIIAGMGGELICNILRESIKIAHSAKEIILQPMNGIEKVRKFLYENDFKITEEKLAKEDRRIYVIIKAIQGQMENLNEIDFEISPFLDENDSLYPHFKAKKIKEAEKILNGMKNGKFENKERAEYYRNILKKLTKE